MKRSKHPPLHERKAAVIAAWQRGDDSEAARIMTEELRVPTRRNAIYVWRGGGYSKLEPLYIEAMEKAQAQRAERARQAA